MKNSKERDLPLGTHVSFARMTSAPGAISPPDGGYGWVIVFSSFFIHFMCNGLTLAMGVLCVAWYEEFNSSKTETSWIVSMATAVMLVMGEFTSYMLYSFKPKIMSNVIRMSRSQC